MANFMMPDVDSTPPQIQGGGGNPFAGLHGSPQQMPGPMPSQIAQAQPMLALDMLSKQQELRNQQLTARNLDMTFQSNQFELAQAMQKQNAQQKAGQIWQQHTNPDGTVNVAGFLGEAAGNPEIAPIFDDVMKSALSADQTLAQTALARAQQGMQANTAIGITMQGLLKTYPNGTSIPTSAAIGAVNMLYAEHVLTADEAEFWMGAVNTNMQKYGPDGVRHLAQFAMDSSNMTVEQYQKNMPKMQAVVAGGHTIMIDENPSSPTFGQPIVAVQHTVPPEFGQEIITQKLPDGREITGPRDEVAAQLKAMNSGSGPIGGASGPSAMHSAGDAAAPAITAPGSTTGPAQAAPTTSGDHPPVVTDPGQTAPQVAPQVAPVQGDDGGNGPGGMPGSSVSIGQSANQQAYEAGQIENTKKFESELIASQDSADKILMNVGAFERLRKDSSTGPQQNFMLPLAKFAIAMGATQLGDEVAGGNYSHVMALGAIAINSAMAESKQMGGISNRDLSATELETFQKAHGGVYDTPETLHELFGYLSKFAQVKKDEMRLWTLWKQNHNKNPNDFIDFFENEALPKLSKKYGMDFKLVPRVDEGAPAQENANGQ